MNSYIVKNTFIDGFAPDSRSNASSAKASSDPTSSRSRSISVESCSDGSVDHIGRGPCSKAGPSSPARGPCSNKAPSVPVASGTAVSHFKYAEENVRDHNRDLTSEAPLSTDCTFSADSPTPNEPQDMNFVLHQKLTEERRNKIYLEWQNLNANTIPEQVFAVDAEGTTYMGPHAVDVVSNFVLPYPVTLTFRGQQSASAPLSNSTASNRRTSDRRAVADPSEKKAPKKELTETEVLRRRKHAQVRRARISRAKAEERGELVRDEDGNLVTPEELVKKGSPEVPADGSSPPSSSVPAKDDAADCKLSL